MLKGVKYGVCLISLLTIVDSKEFKEDRLKSKRVIKRGSKKKGCEGWFSELAMPTLKRMNISRMAFFKKLNFKVLKVG